MKKLALLLLLLPVEAQAHDQVAVPKPTCECCVHRRGCPIPRVAQWWPRKKGPNEPYEPGRPPGQSVCTCVTTACDCPASGPGGCGCDCGGKGYRNGLASCH